MPTETKNVEQFNSSPEDKELNQYISDIILPISNTAGVPQSPLFSSQVDTSTLQPSYMLSSVTFTQEQNEKTPIDNIIKKQKTLNVTTTNQLNMSDTIIAKSTNINVTLTPKGAIHVFPLQPHYGPNEFQMKIIDGEYLITTKVIPSTQEQNFNVEVIYQFYGLPKHSFKFSHCPSVSNNDNETTNIDSEYNTS
jgi:hypothetical protein